MNKNNNYFEIIVGTFVLICALFFLFSSMKTAKVGPTAGYQLIAKFDNVSGVNIGSEVKISGVKIGVVEEQSLDDENYRAILKFRISEEIKIPADSSIKIASESLLGGKHLAIEIGADEEFLNEGDEIEFTQSSINFEDLLGRFMFSGDNKNKNSQKQSE